ncbi:hypothetical protein R1flu_015343 [Riccia fluitans]|uniref:Uncharacterized protein n=1 Tax=Riccia fluitans TaxID=41844 RepID=A0ABD1YLT9_9MARC
MQKTLCGQTLTTALIKEPLLVFYSRLKGCGQRHETSFSNIQAPVFTSRSSPISSRVSLCPAFPDARAYSTNQRLEFVGRSNSFGLEVLRFSRRECLSQCFESVGGRSGRLWS